MSSEEPALSRKKGAEAAEALLKRLGKGAGLSCLMRQVGFSEGDDHDWRQVVGRVNAVDRSGVWLIFAGEEDVQTLWPAEHYEYDEIDVSPPPPKSKPITQQDLEEEEPSPRKRNRKKPLTAQDAPASDSGNESADGQHPQPKRKARREPQQPITQADQLTSAITTAVSSAVQAALASISTLPRQNTRLADAIVDGDIRDIASGDAGVWTQLVPGLKIPIHTQEETQWAYLDAPLCTIHAQKCAVQPTFTSPQDWAVQATTFRLRKGVTFRTLSPSNEAEYLVQIISELLSNHPRPSRTLKSQWLAPFYLVSRLLHLFILGSSLGGAAAAARFTMEFEKCIHSSDSKLDFGALIAAALAAPATTASAGTAPATPQAQDTVSLQDVYKKIDPSVAQILDANGYKTKAAPRK